MNTSFDDEISLAELIDKLRSAVQLLWAERQMIAIRIGLAGIIGLIIAFGSPVEYSARMRLLPYRGGGAAGTSGISGLAGLAGIRLPIGNGDQTITADLYPEVAKSLAFRIAIAETPLRFSTLDKPATTVEYFRRIRQPALTEVLASYSIGLPTRLASLVRNREKEQAVARANPPEQIVANRYDEEYLSIVQLLEKRLAVSIDKKTGIIQVTSKMPDPEAAADLARISSDGLMKRIIDYESQKAAEHFRFINEQHQKAKARYEYTQRELATFSDRNRSLMSATAQIDRNRLQGEYDLAFEVYQQFSRELEQARIKMSQDTPVFTVLDHSIVPNNHESPRRKRIVMVALFLGMLTGIAQVELRRLQNSLRAK
jgi:uncharacterized protein involved in exopolysaccharide biosynthesis